MATDGKEGLLEEAVLYLTGKMYNDGISNNKKRQIRAKAKKFVWKSDELYYNPGKNKPICLTAFFLLFIILIMVKYIKSRSDQKRIVKSCHLDATSGNLGVWKTVSRIFERFMWQGILKDVKEMVSTCNECQRMNKPSIATVTELHPVPIHSPWYHVGMH
uniref:Integrase zinc-binding domain-containing protein n=1 Tax=Amphimedon queenslandica TaxID=400682 RepID=A0A1X7VKG2_AMPQE